MAWTDPIDDILKSLKPFENQLEQYDKENYFLFAIAGIILLCLGLVFYLFIIAPRLG